MRRSSMVRGLVLAFALASGSAVIYLGPIQGYQNLDFIHCWIHITLAVIGLLCSLSLLASRIYLTIASLIFLSFALGGFYYSGHFMHMHFMPNPYVNFVHLGLTALFFYMGVFFKTKKD